MSFIYDWQKSGQLGERRGEGACRCLAAVASQELVRRHFESVLQGF